MRTVKNPMAAYGRSTDSMMAHVTPGEMIVPREVTGQNPQLALAIAQAIREAGADPAAYIVGHDMKINPETGQPEFFFKKIKKIFKKVAPIAAIGLGGLGLAGLGPLAGLGGVLGGVGGSLGSAGQILSGISSASSLLGGGQKAPQITIENGQRYEDGKISEIQPAQAEVFSPKRPDALNRPESLNELSAFSPEQERSYLATQGLNTGLGSAEDQYYKNLIQRSLIGENNNVQQQSDNFLMPVESQYFSKRGYNTSNVMDFLRAIRG